MLEAHTTQSRRSIAASQGLGESTLRAREKRLATSARLDRLEALLERLVVPAAAIIHEPTPTPQPTEKPRVRVQAGTTYTAPPVPPAPAEYSNSSILVVSDLHAPYEHPDALAFLDALKNAYQPERVICTGDETDGHAMSFHTSDTRLPSAGAESDQAREFMGRLHAIFPIMDVMHSNHGSLIYRRAQDAGLPDHAMQSYRGFLFGQSRPDGSTYFHQDIGSRWRWHHDLEIVLPTGEKCLFAHGLATNVKLAVQKAGSSVVQGHYHSSYDCVALQGPKGAPRFGITGGCMIDPDSYAYAYGRNIPLRPVIGCSGILDGLPVQFRMPLDTHGRWTGRLPYGILPGRDA